MPENERLRSNAGTNRRVLRRASAPWRFLVGSLTLIGALSVAVAQQLPPGGKTSWEIQGPEEIVTFVGSCMPSSLLARAPVTAPVTRTGSKKGDHALSRGVFVGPTYMTTYEAPLKGSAYQLRKKDKQ